MYKRQIWTWISRKYDDDDDDDTTWEEAAAPRQPILDLRARAGVSVDLSVVQHLPTLGNVRTPVAVTGTRMVCLLYTSDAADDSCISYLSGLIYVGEPF